MRRRSDGDAARSRILQYVQGCPGVCKSQLCRDLGIAWGTASYHLGILLKAQAIKTFSRGKEVRLFPVGISDRKSAMLAVLYEPGGAALISALRDRPGSQIGQLANDAGISRKVIRRHLTLLGGEQLLETLGEKRPRYRLGHLSSDILTAIIEGLGRPRPGESLDPCQGRLAEFKP